MKEKTYSIVMKNSTNSPFWHSLKDGSKPIIEQTDKQTYRKLNLEAALIVLKEFIDAPEEDLTLEYVKNEFKSSNAEMSDKIAQKIVDYYNGRRKIYNNLKDLLESGEFEYEKVEIPEELNGFTTQEIDEDFEKCQFLESWIEIIAD